MNFGVVMYEFWYDYVKQSIMKKENHFIRYYHYIVIIFACKNKIYL